MNKVKKIFKENKKVILIIGIIVVLLVALLVAFLVFGGNNTNKQEKTLTKYIDEMGRDFYENFYYEQIGKDDDARINFVQDFKDIGIKINLDNLSRYTTNDEEKDKKFADMIAEFKNKKTNTECNKENTRIIIYPTSPYHKTDYNVEINLDCGF